MTNIKFLTDNTALRFNKEIGELFFIVLPYRLFHTVLQLKELKQLLKSN